MPMPDDYVQKSFDQRIFPWTLLPERTYKWFTRWLGGHYISEDR